MDFFFATRVAKRTTKIQIKKELHGKSWNSGLL